MPNDDVTFSQNGALVCPCGGDYLHQSVVTVYSSIHEDTPHVQQTTVDFFGSLTVKPKVDRYAVNVGRRDGLSVGFWCENCGREGIVLVINQHKGQTLLSWDVTKARPLNRDPEKE